eukprot:2954992-Rhodomonas_salina.1
MLYRATTRYSMSGTVFALRATTPRFAVLSAYVATMRYSLSGTDFSHSGLPPPVLIARMLLPGGRLLAGLCCYYLRRLSRRVIFQR